MHLINDAKINGIAINLSSLIKIVPTGLIQLLEKFFPPSNCNKMKPKKLNPEPFQLLFSNEVQFFFHSWVYIFQLTFFINLFRL